MIEYCTLYVTVRDKAEAVSLARELIKEKLIACANISGGILSIYPWEGKICEDSERAVFMKTRKDLVEKVTNRIKQLHSYDTPCIVQWDITGGSEAYLTWVGENLLISE
ncbi:Periplasmic divalent cation tolerance protein cutA [hydrothermal vent metagenome]|uniref:Periplasmic divalent cation tolerance protein cutA n=1 Tax=hydrothermal vent metagenome TaxID=652676 RepID=A0A3B1BCF7_9ZZZZ